MADSSSSVRMGDSYKKGSSLQKTATGRAVESKILVQRLVKYIEDNPIEFKSEAPLRIAEFGCADGSNSVEIFRQLVETIRSLNQTKPIELLCSDLPLTNFSGVFDRLNPLREEFRNVYVSVIGDSFYSQIFADSSIDMAFSFSSVHWLKKAPCYLGSAMYTPQGLEGLVEEAIQVWKRQAQDDWVMFLERRQKELKPQGFVYVSTIGYHDHPNTGDAIHARVHRDMMNSIVNVLESENLGDHKAEFNLPMALRQREDYLKPFNEETVQGLRAEVYEDYSFEIDIFSKLLEKGDTETVLKMMKMGSQAMSGPYYKTKLSQIEGLSDEKRTEIWNRIYDGMTEEIAKYINDMKDNRSVHYNEFFFRRS